MCLVLLEPVTFIIKCFNTLYEYLDNNFTNLISKDRRFSRIFTSVIENQKLDLIIFVILISAASQIGDIVVSVGGGSDAM